LLLRQLAPVLSKTLNCLHGSLCVQDVFFEEILSKETLITCLAPDIIRFVVSCPAYEEKIPLSISAGIQLDCSPSPPPFQLQSDLQSQPDNNNQQPDKGWSQNFLTDQIMNKNEGGNLASGFQSDKLNIRENSINLATARENTIIANNCNHIEKDIQLSVSMKNFAVKSWQPAKIAMLHFREGKFILTFPAGFFLLKGKNKLYQSR
jgi:hypothetical protein